MFSFVEFRFTLALTEPSFAAYANGKGGKSGRIVIQSVLTLSLIHIFLEGKHDEIPEQMFLFAGGIDEVVEKYEKSKK